MIGFTGIFDIFLTIAVMLLASVPVILAFVILAPFALRNRTSSGAERLLGNLVSSEIKVMGPAVIAGIGLNLCSEFAAVSQDPESGIGHAMALCV